jgi:hypothetical protein
MNRKYLILLFAAVSILCMSSCEKAINVNIPPQTSKLTINCVAEVGMPFYLLAGRTGSLKDRNTNPDLAIGNAVVKLYVDGVYTETMKYQQSFGYYSVAIVEAGKKYSVEVSAPSYGDASASAVAPVPVAISNVVRTYAVRKDENGNFQDALDISFSDPSAAGDFYIININAPQDSMYHNYGFCVNSPDVSIETPEGDIGDVNTCLSSGGIFMRDVLFNGGKKEIRFYVNSDILGPFFNGTDSVYATMELYHVSEDYFRYVQTQRVAADTDGNPFAEPVNVYSNVSNGYGIFSIISSDIMEVK